MISERRTAASGGGSNINAATESSDANRMRQNNSRRNAAAVGKAFNPKLIFSQIVALQCFHYFILALMFQFNHLAYKNSITIDRIFTDKYLNLYTLGGWADNAAVLLSSLIW